MSKMKLFHVNVNYSVPVGAEDAMDAKDLVIELLRGSPKYDDDAIGFGEAEFEVSEIKSMVLVPECWKNAELFNTADLDNVKAEDILKESVDGLAHKNAKRKLDQALNLLGSKVTKEDIIKWVSENPNLK